MWNSHKKGIREATNLNEADNLFLKFVKRKTDLGISDIDI